jgi:hypothetical protein
MRVRERTREREEKRGEESRKDTVSLRKVIPKEVTSAFSTIFTIEDTVFCRKPACSEFSMLSVFLP